MKRFFFFFLFFLISSGGRALADRVRHCEGDLSGNFEVQPFSGTSYSGETEFPLSGISDIVTVGRHGGTQANTARVRARNRLVDCYNDWLANPEVSPSVTSECDNTSQHGHDSSNNHSDFESKVGVSAEDLVRPYICGNAEIGQYGNVDVTASFTLEISGGPYCGSRNDSLSSREVNITSSNVHGAGLYGFCHTYSDAHAEDSDSDGRPNAFDPDNDGDGVDDPLDNCPNGEEHDSTHVTFMHDHPGFMACKDGNLETTHYTDDDVVIFEVASDGRFLSSLTIDQDTGSCAYNNESKTEYDRIEDGQDSLIGLFPHMPGTATIFEGIGSTTPPEEGSEEHFGGGLGIRVPGVTLPVDETEIEEITIEGLFTVCYTDDGFVLNDHVIPQCPLDEARPFSIRSVPLGALPHGCN